jgi:hypothetical protein
VAVLPLARLKPTAQTLVALMAVTPVSLPLFEREGLVTMLHDEPFQFSINGSLLELPR